MFHPLPLQQPAPADKVRKVWGELAKKIATKAKSKGYILTDNVVSLSIEEVAAIAPFGPILWGTNSRGRATRARKALGWKPKGVPLEETLDDVIELEARVLGLRL